MILPGAMYIGFVTDNKDPEPHLGRVRVRVPGLLEPESSWAMPLGRMYGVNDGHWQVPAVDSSVAVWLHQGHPDHPYYMSAAWGAPKGVQDAPSQAGSPANVDIYSVRWKNFHITMDGRTGVQKLTIEDIPKGTKITMDRTSGDLNITSTAKCVITAPDVQVAAGLSSSAATGARTTNYIGGVTGITIGTWLETVTGVLSFVVSGVLTFTVAGVLNIAGALGINLGVGTLRALIDDRIIAALNAHTHPHALGPGVTGIPTQQIVPGGMPPNVDENLVKTSQVKAS